MKFDKRSKNSTEDFTISGQIKTRHTIKIVPFIAYQGLQNLGCSPSFKKESKDAFERIKRSNQKDQICI